MSGVHRVLARCADLGGIARTFELAGRGVTRRELAAAVASGAILRLREGVFAHPHVDPQRRAAATHGGELACISAAAADGLWALPFTGVHVALPMRGRGHAHTGCDCVTHRTSRPVRLGGRSEARHAIIDILRCQGEEACFVVLESAMRRRRIGRSDLARVRAAMPASSRWLVDLARWDADSGLESLLRIRLRACGLELHSQVEIPGVGRVDFVIGDRLILEVDGRENHDGPSMRHKDLVRDAIAAALGFETLRFDYSLVLHDWETVIAAVLGRVSAGAHVDSRRAW